MNSFDEYLQNYLEHENDDVSEILHQMDLKEQYEHDMYDVMRDKELI